MADGGRQGAAPGDLRERITQAVCAALAPLPQVLAAWEGGSAAFDLVDEYSDLDLNVLLDDAADVEAVQAAVAAALEMVSPIVTSHREPPGRYYKLEEGGEFLLVDVCTFRRSALGDCLDAERHGELRPLFDKGRWLRSEASAAVSRDAKRAQRRHELDEWFPVSQSFVRKAILRGREVEALAAYWGYTLKPLVELLRMRYCPARWDFGMRSLERDLPGPVYTELRELIFVGEPGDLAARFAQAVAWGERLLAEWSTLRRGGSPLS